MCLICYYYGVNSADILSEKFFHIDSDNTPPKYSSTNEIKYVGLFSDYSFHNFDKNKYHIKTYHGFDEITGISTIIFSDRTINTAIDIQGTFDQITGLNTTDAKIFRLYNSATKGLADPEGLRYWINELDKREMNIRSIAKELMMTDEFKNIYSIDSSNEQYVNSLYQNILNRDADTAGFTYWVGQLNKKEETKEEIWLGITESAENKLLFSKMTGFY